VQQMSVDHYVKPLSPMSKHCSSNDALIPLNDPHPDYEYGQIVQTVADPTKEVAIVLAQMVKAAADLTPVLV
jgi:hypothetical protein